MPSGLGAVVVNARYLVRHGAPLSRALATVAPLHVAGLPAGLVLLAALLMVRRTGRGGAVARAVRGMTELSRCPGVLATRDFALTMAASVAMTLACGIAFALSVLASPARPRMPGG